MVDIGHVRDGFELMASSQAFFNVDRLGDKDYAQAYFDGVILSSWLFFYSEIIHDLSNDESVTFFQK